MCVCVYVCLAVKLNGSLVAKLCVLLFLNLNNSMQVQLERENRFMCLLGYTTPTAFLL